MMLFAIVAIPLFTLLLYSAPRPVRNREGGFGAGLRLQLRRGFLPGLALGIPVWLALMLLARLLPLSYRPLRLYLFFSFREYLLPSLLGLLLAAWLRRDKNFTDLLFFLAGLYTLLNWGQLAAGTERPDLYRLCLLDSVRMAQLVYLPLLYLRFAEEEGALRLLFLGLMLLVALMGGLVAYLHMRFYIWPALGLGIAMPVSAVILLIGPRERRSLAGS